MDSQAGLHCFIQATEINTAVVRLASEITRDYRDRNPVLIGILKGSFIFMADLVRQLDFPIELDFIRLSSYGDSRKTSGRVEVKLDIGTDVGNRNLLVVEDIVDTGLTISFLLDYLKKKEPASIKLCALTEKPSRRQVPLDIDYLGFTVPDKFLVGYGLDYAGKYRNLPDICILDV
jgi:hypoxanthine phosphoribosyltransferase